MLTAGTKLGHYVILGPIGAGGMGEVYRAHDDRLERDVALKVLPAGTLADDAARQRFRKEALALARLNHPNIATVHDFDTQEGADFLVMELVAGASLAEKVAIGPLLEKEILRLASQLVEGLLAAHEQKVVHRDLKPANLRVTPDGRLKILDFGLAKLLRPARDEAVTAESLARSQPGVAGTVPYMSPEQLRGEPVDARTDIYAAGCVLYEMATGRRPFQETLSTALTDAILHKPAPPPGRLQPDLSPDLERIILKCLEKDPENRYQSAKELLVDLRRLAAPVTVPTTVQPSGPRRWAAP
ncbi:MAG: serine/threonine protein kinase, partial [Acidobacteria bacterium]|nr:serine/threonine protein kinase [Acidobacteriota bacterium]